MLKETVDDLLFEVERAVDKHGEFNSSHEFIGVLDEEFFEVKLEIFKQEGDRDYNAIYAEALQVAAVALKYADQLRDVE